MEIPQLVQVIVGEKLAKNVSTTGTSLIVRPPIDPYAQVALEVSELSNDSISDINLSIRRGEIVGLIGSIGSGRTELLESIYGIRKLESGVIRASGVDVVIRKPQDAISQGIKLVPEDRHRYGLVLDHDIASNTAMGTLPLLSKFRFLFDSKESKAFASRMVDQLKVVAPSTSTKLDKLSGGNQQKIAIAKWLGSETKVLLLDEPTAGVDVGARADIYKIISELADQGTAVLVCSSDYDELLQLCSRFVFLKDGSISASAERSQVQDEKDLHQILESIRKEPSNV